MGRSCQKWLDKILTYDLLPFQIVPLTTYFKFRLAQPVWVRSHITQVERGGAMDATIRLAPPHYDRPCSDLPSYVPTYPVTFRLAP